MDIASLLFQSILAGVASTTIHGPFRSLVCQHHFSHHLGGNKTRADTWIRLCVATSHCRHGIVSNNKPISGRETG